MHSWPKFKIVLIKKVGWKSYYCPSFLVMWSKTWMVVVFPIQVFGHMIKNLDGSGFSHPNFLDSSSFYHPTFLTVVLWQVFFLEYSTNFEFLSGMLLLWNINGSSSFCKGPRARRVRGLWDFACPRTFVKTTTPVYISQ